eukprot:5367769-Pyramimonas_sp.AAC.1
MEGVESEDLYEAFRSAGVNVEKRALLTAFRAFQVKRAKRECHFQRPADDMSDSVEDSDEVPATSRVSVRARGDVALNFSGT